MKINSLLKNYLSALAIFLCVIPFKNYAQNQTAKEAAGGFELYLLAGQSNMAGRGPLNDSLRVLHDDRVWVLTKNLTWTVAHHPLHFDKPRIAGVGPGLSFGIEMANAHSGAKIGLIPCAVGGTSIDKWQPGAFDDVTSTHPYDDAAARIVEAMKNGKVRGVIWLQGEADANKEMVEEYLHKLKVLVKRFRKLAGDKELPVVVCELGHYRPNYQMMNAELNKAPSHIKNLKVVSSEGLTDKGDKTHFDSESAIIYGKRIAKKILEIQNRK